MSRSNPQPPSSFIGVPKLLASRLRWLESTHGTQSLDKFLDAKIHLEPYVGQYVRGLWREPSAARFIAQLLDQLRQGGIVPLSDIASYYANDKCPAKGMQLSSGKLIDVW